MRSAEIAVAAAVAVFLSGCMVGPNYKRPPVSTPPAFKEAAGWAPANPSDAAERSDWWTAFGDPTLDSLEARVAVSNQNLAAALAAYQQARALVAEQRAALFPTVGLSAQASAAGGGRGAAKAGGGSVSTASYQVGADASWAPDIWGAVRRAVQNARANAQASAADLANARLSAQMELAVDYVTLCELDQQKRLLDATVAAYRISLTITQNKYKAGNVALSDVLSAKAQLEAAEAQDADLANQRAADEHAIAILTGVPPADLTLPAAAWSLALPAIPTEIPSTLLERRPDIAAAERQMAAANAEIGVNVAALYPTLNLTGEAGFASSSLSTLFSAPSFAWTAAASLAETIFEGGLRHARIRAAKAAFDEAVANYRQTVLTAFGQVEDNLAAQRILGGEEAYRAEASADADRDETIALNQYRAGQV
ncbi:MAG: efflux transporter outer membrane subunit, partial [Caulobacteraceae bacterium]